MGFKEIALYVLMFIIGCAVFYCLNIPVYKLPEEKQEKKKVRDVCMAIFGGAAAVFLAAFYGYTLQALTVFLFYAVLSVITLIDHDTMEIPFCLNVIVFLIGVLSIWTIGGHSIADRIIGMLCISVPMYLIILIIPNGFGGGDIKLMFAAGFLLGWKATLLAFLIGILAGGIYGVFVLLTRKKTGKDHFAFGPFLSVGLAVSVICGDYLLNTYIEFLKSLMTY